MNSIRLLAFIEAYDVTGPAKNLMSFARLARAENIETTIATFTRGASSNIFIETAQSQGLPLQIIPERGLYDWNVLTAIKSIVRSFRPDIIQTHAVKSHFLARSARLTDYAPWVAFHHGYTWPTLRARVYNHLDRWSLRSALKVLTVSIPFRDQLITAGVDRDRIEIVHNAIRPDWARAARNPETAARLRGSLGIGPDTKIVLTVGRLSREKDQTTLIKAVHRLRRRLKVRLLIVGGGPERRRIEEQIHRLGMESDVTLTGQQASAEPYYGIADVAVLSSLSEGSPNALLEALAAGVPVVATRVGGIPEIVAHGESALLVEPGEIDLMASSLLRLLVEDTGLAAQMASQGRRLVVERHSPEARIRFLAGLYRSVISRSSPA